CSGRAATEAAAPISWLLGRLCRSLLGWHAGFAGESIEVEGANGFGQIGLLGVEEPADLLTDDGDRNGSDVIAGDHGAFLQAVGVVDWDLGGEPTDPCGDRSDRDRVQMRAHRLAGEDENRAGLVQSRPVDRSHQRSIEPPATWPASASRSVSGPDSARIFASCAAVIRRRSSPFCAIVSMKSTSSSESRTAICLLIP